MNYRLVILAVLLAAPLYGRSRVSRSPQQLPLMPPAVASARTTSASTTPELYQPYGGAKVTAPVREKRSKVSAMGIGLELGLLGRANKTQSDVAGMQLFWGGRAFSRMPLAESLFLVPSLGYFRKQESNGSAGVTQHIIEAGLGAYYAAWTGRKARWLIGGNVRGEYAISQISALNSDSSSGAEFRLRAGPATGVAIGISPDFSFVADIEVGIALGPTVRVQPGIAMGFIYYLP